MRDWASALVDRKMPDASGIRGRIARARFKHRRRTLEAQLFAAGPITLWHVVKEQNNELGVWK